MVCQSVTGWAPASREVESHGGSFCASTVRRIGFAAAFAPRLFPCDGPCQTLTVRWWRNQLHSPASPHLLRVASFRLPPKAFRPRLSCQGFFPLRGATEGIELCVGAQPTASSALRLSQPLDGLLHLRLRGPVPSHSHVQGLLFRGFSLRAATFPHREEIPPCRLSDGCCWLVAGSTVGAPRLRGFAPRRDAFFADGVEPSPQPLPSSVFSSSRSSFLAVARFPGPSALGVRR
jgi:hypothetical protein